MRACVCIQREGRETHREGREIEREGRRDVVREKEDGTEGRFRMIGRERERERGREGR